MSDFGDEDNYDDFDEDFYDLLIYDEPDTLIDDLVGTAWGHEPPYQPDTYDAYDSDSYYDQDSADDEYFDGELNPLPATHSTPTLPSQSQLHSHPPSPLSPRQLLIQEKISQAMKGKKFYGADMPFIDPRHPRKRRKLELATKYILGIDVHQDKNEQQQQQQHQQHQPPIPKPPSNPLRPSKQTLPLPILTTATKNQKLTPPISPPVSPPLSKPTKPTHSTYLKNATTATVGMANNTSTCLQESDSGGENLSLRKRKANTPLSPDRK